MGLLGKKKEDPYAGMTKEERKEAKERAKYERQKAAREAREEKKRRRRGRRGEEEEPASPDAQDSVADALSRGKKDGEKKRKRMDLLSSVIRESVPSASLNEIKANREFFLQGDGRPEETAALAFMVYADDLGGLNRHVKDPDKGQFLKQIEGSSIHIFADEAFLEEEKFLLIPDEETMKNMDEYSFLCEPDRFSRFIPTIVTWDQTGTMSFDEIQDCPQPFSFLKQIGDGDYTAAQVMDILGLEDDADTDGSDSDSEEEEAAGPVPVTAQAGADDDDDEPAGPAPTAAARRSTKKPSLEKPVPPAGDAEAETAFGGGDGEADFGAEDTGFPDDVPEAFGDDGFSVPEGGPAHRPVAPVTETGMINCEMCGTVMPMDARCPKCGWKMPSDDDDLPVDEDEEIPEELVMGAVSQVFYHGDLDLEVNTDGFDAQYLKDDRFTKIPEDRGDGWLDHHVTQMVKNANAELLALHRKNLTISRDRYMELLHMACHVIEEQVSVRGDTTYAQLATKAMLDKEAKVNSASEEIEKRESALRAQWEKEREQQATAAAERARSDYDRQYQRSHDAEIRGIRTDIEDSFQTEYDNDIRLVNDMRRTEAARLFNAYVNQALLTVGSRYKRLLEEEDALRRKRLREIQEYVDNHRKEDVARMYTLQQQLRDNKGTDAMRHEMDRRLSEQRQRYEELQRRLQSDMDACTRHMESQKQMYEEKISTITQLQQDDQAALREMMEKYTTLQEDVAEDLRAEYEERIRTLENDKRSAQEHLEHVDRIHGTYNKISVAVWVAIAAMMFMVGILAGGKFGSTQPVRQDYTIQVDAPQEADAVQP